MSCPGRACTRIRTSSSSVPWKTNRPSGPSESVSDSGETRGDTVHCPFKSHYSTVWAQTSYFNGLCVLGKNAHLRLQTHGGARCPPPALQRQPHRGWEHPSSPSSPDQASLCEWAEQRGEKTTRWTTPGTPQTFDIKHVSVDTNLLSSLGFSDDEAVARAVSRWNRK